MAATKQQQIGSLPGGVLHGGQGPSRLATCQALVNGLVAVQADTQPGLRSELCCVLCAGLRGAAQAAALG